MFKSINKVDAILSVCINNDLIDLGTCKLICFGLFHTLIFVASFCF